MSGEATAMAWNMGALCVALLPLLCTLWWVQKARNRAVDRCVQLERVIDQCAGIIKPMARKSELVNTNTTMSRHQRAEHDELLAAARAIDVVRGADHGH